MVLISVCVFERETVRERVQLAARVNLFDQSLHLIPVYFHQSDCRFSFTLSSLCAAKAFPLKQ